MKVFSISDLLSEKTWLLNVGGFINVGVELRLEDPLAGDQPIQSDSDFGRVDTPN